MKNNNSKLSALSVIRTSISTLFANKIILFPFMITAFVQLLVLEIFYFAPRYPLNIFFGPIIRKLWAENYLHYPVNFVLLPKLFQYAQVPIYLFISSFFVAIAVKMIFQLNEDKKIEVGREIGKGFSSYIYVIISAVFSFLLVLLFFKGYGLVLRRAINIRSTSGLYFWIKNVVIFGAPYFNLILSVLATTILAYMIPAIVIDKKKIIGAVVTNFKVLFQSFFTTFLIVLIPSLLYAPVLLLRGNINFGPSLPEINAVLVIVSVIVMFAIDAIVYTAITTNYLLKKEKR